MDWGLYISMAVQVLAFLTAFIALWVEIKKMHAAVNGNLTVLIAAVVASSEAATKAAKAAAEALKKGADG